MLLRHFLHKEDPSLKMSFPQEETLYGVRIRKLPGGKYLQAMNAIEGLPAALMKALFPNGQSLEQMLAVFSQLNTEGAAAILSRLLGTLPEEFCRLACSLLDIPESRVLDPDATDALSLGELTEILEAFWQMNDLSAFFGIARRLIQTAAGTPAAGSSAGSPALKTSG